MPEPRAVLVGVLTPDREAASLEASLDELSRLCDTLGLVEVGRVTQRQRSTGKAALLGRGKLAELAAWTGGTGRVHRGPGSGDDDDDDDDDELPPVDPDAPRRADLVVVDHELTPTQLRNLKAACGVEVLDRNGVIIEIFSNRARTREARLQVELARLTYLAPRLRELGGPSERQRGGIGGKGTGETALELDRRRVRDRIAEIRHELETIEADRGRRRERRKDLRQVALVGYTNAGKSSLMRALTGADPYVANQLFATLDTTVRRLTPEPTPPILVTDTVGFIQDLPHSLVASFRSTLDAALEAGLLLHVVDASDPAWRDQERVTVEVLAEIGAEDLPRRLVLNKTDLLPPEAVDALQRERADAWVTSARDPERVRTLRDHIVASFAANDAEFDLFVPWSHGRLTGLVRARAEVLAEEWEDAGVRYRLRAPPDDAAMLQAAASEPE
ncbi:MAG: GTPase HflX [Myxococcota bacterium]